MSIGIFHPCILLPKQDYTEAQQQHILKHECIHIQHKDILTKVLIGVFCRIWWWNPTVYLLKKDVAQVMEMRCDGEVAQGMNRQERASYLETLLMVIKRQDEAGQEFEGGVFLVTVNAPVRIKERFDYVAGDIRTDKKGKVLLWVLTLGMFALSYMIVIQSRFEAPMSEIEGQEGYYAIDMENSYLIHCDDGRYIMHTSGGEEIEIDEEEAIKIKKIGFQAVEQHIINK